MGAITKLVFFFLFSLSWGVSLYSPLAPTKETGADFFKLINRVSIISLFLAFGFYFASDYQIGSGFVIFGAVAAILSIVQYVYHEDEKSLLMWGLYFLTQFFFYMSFKGLAGLFVEASTMFGLYHLLTSLLFLGSITFSMILGHWYLVTPKLSELPLKYANYASIGLLVIKICLSTYAYFYWSDYFEAGTMKGEGYMFNTVLAVMRGLWGYLIIGILAFYSHRLISMRSIQSATGVLYVMTFFVFIGELISNFIYFKMGICL